MKVQQLVMVCGAYLLVGHLGVEALTCYECNSHIDSRCADKKPPDALQKDCQVSAGGTKYTMCRKTVQSIEFPMNGLPPETRVIRTCGYDESNYKGRCYQRSGFGGRQEVCSCLTNLCNGSTPSYAHVPQFLMILCLLGSALNAHLRN
ncbi:uncharacterized protein [Venturia canescens]|uniref:uncharacterized protein n=1 Tax=Venturia canescens TaxID=32260 RepID=UPI001C9C038C|nr:uncharacterized protein LOC122407762 [Venturia canescens]